MAWDNSCWNRALEMRGYQRGQIFSKMFFIQPQLLIAIIGVIANPWDAQFTRDGFGGGLRLYCGMLGIGLARCSD